MLPAQNLDLLSGLVGARSLVLALLRVQSHGEQSGGEVGGKRSSARGVLRDGNGGKREHMRGAAKGMNEEYAVNL
jgi:hypothetical protein